MLLFLSIFGVLQIAAGAGSPNPEVTISQGRLRGLVQQTIHGRKFNAFLGIPYAQPPIGQLRFKEARPSEPWLGVWNATHKGEDCLQTVWHTENPEYDVVGSEDCLFVNVYTPKLPGGQGGKLLDVLVYIHGGGFQYLSAATYGPEFILDKDVIYVSFNYRLGTLGFLSLGDEIVPGNNGLKDQNLALKWVKQNIAAFGGDPNRVTLCGMSAGGASVHYHLLSKKAEGLFQKAIITSGAATNPWALSVNVPQKSLAVAAMVGCPTASSEEVLKCLQQRPAAEILRAHLKLKTIYDLPISPIGPTIENSGPSAYIDKQPYDIIRNGESIDVPILWSVNSEEGMFPGMSLLGEESKILDENWDRLMPHIMELNDTVEPKRQLQIVHQLKEHYLGGKKINDRPGQLIAMIGDRYFYNGVFESVKLHAEHNTSPVWMYKFSIRASVRITDGFGKNEIYEGGACHGDDLHYVLKASYAPVDQTPKDIEIIHFLTGLWMDFIQGQPKWKEVKEGLPDLTVLEIVSSNPKENLVKSLKRTPGQELWLSFSLSENSGRRMKNEL